MGTASVTRRQWSRSRGVGAVLNRNSGMTPSRLVCVAPQAMTSSSQRLGLKRRTICVRAPAVSAASVCAQSALMWKSGMET